MIQFQLTREIDAPVELVFATVADIRNFSQALPHVVKYEFLTDQQTGVGTRFRETRLMQGREAATELEVTEYVENEHVRMVADSHGAVWDSVFAVEPTDVGTSLSLTMDARPYKLLPKLLIPLTKGLIAKAVNADMDLVKSYCEANAS